MKLVFTILVLLALLTEGKEKSGVRHANHKNHALGMRKLVKTAVLHEDEALRNFNGTAMPELPERFQFPVVVDLTEFERMLEQRFNSINGNIESLRLKLRDMIQCQSGSEETGWETGAWEKHKMTITFPRSFRSTPALACSVTTADSNFTGDPAGGFRMWYKTNQDHFDVTYFTSETESGHKARFGFSWIACGHM